MESSTKGTSGTDKETQLVFTTMRMGTFTMGNGRMIKEAARVESSELTVVN
jgi:hypothetical protein